MSRDFLEASSEYLFNSTTLVSGFPFTLVCWAYITDTVNDHAFVSLSDVDTNDHYSKITFQNTGGVFQASVRDGTTSASSAGVMSVNTWYHCAGVFTSTTSRLAYLNGSAGTENTDTRSDMTNIDSVSVGGQYTATPTDFQEGRIADAAIWNVALTQNEVTTLSLGISPLLVRPASLIFYLPLIRDNDIDWIGGLSMSANGTPTIADHPPSVGMPLLQSDFSVSFSGPDINIDFTDINRERWIPGVVIQ